MLDYNRIDKTDWFIRQMKSGPFSRQEIVAIAAKEFPSLPVKTLDGTIGQYWSDSVNPKWGTFKAIQARGLRVVENAGKRRIVEGSGTFTLPDPIVCDATPTPFTTPAMRLTDTQDRSDGTREMWNTNDADLWRTR